MTNIYTRRVVVTGLAAGLGGLTIGPRVARGTQQDATPAAVGAIDHPTGADELVLRVQVGGGFIPVEFHFTQVPQFSVYGDGRVIFLGPQIEIYPPPALPNLRVLRLSEEGLQQLLAAAGDAGLIGESRHYPNDFVADASTTAFTVNAGGQTAVVTAYALGLDNETVTEEEQTELEQIVAFVERMIDLTSWLPESAIVEPDDAYQIDRLQAVVGAEVFGVTAGAGGTPVPPVAWPLATPLDVFGEPYEAGGLVDGARCAEITGDDLATLLPILQRANVYTPWQSDGQTYQVLFRPLLPDEPACAPP